MKGDDKAMRTFLRHLTKLIKKPAFSSKWFGYSFGFFITGQFLDGLTTKFGFNLGLHEVGTYAKGVNGLFGFWGLMAWKFSIVAAIAAMFFLTYYGTKKYAPEQLTHVSKILTVGCLLAGLVTAQVVLSNISQIELALHPLAVSALF